MAESATSTGAAVAAAPAVVSAALAVIRRVCAGELGLSREALPQDDLVLDLQLDSVGLLTLVVELENSFRVALREEDAVSVHTVADLCALVAQRLVETAGDAAATVRE